MRLDRAFLLCNLLLVLISVITHELAAQQMLHLLLASGVCGAIWISERRGRRLHISDLTGTIICLGAFGISMFRSMAAAGLTGVAAMDIEVPIVGQFLIAFQCVYLLRRKQPRDYIWIYIVSVVHMGTAGLLMPGLPYAFCFVAYTAVGLATISTYTAWMEVRRAGEEPKRVATDRGIVLASLPMTLIVMLPLAGVFMLLPRRPEPSVISQQIVGPVNPVQSVTGFSETVRMGQLGTITENPQRVMNVRFSDPDTGEPIRSGKWLLRGASFNTYAQRRGAWEWRLTGFMNNTWWPLGRGGGDVTRVYGQVFPGFDENIAERVQCEISLEPLSTQVVFVPFASERVEIPRRRLLRGNTMTHDLIQHTRRSPAMEYTVVSRLFDRSRPDLDAPSRPLSRFVRMAYLDLPENLSPRVRELAYEIASPEEYPSPYDRAQRILNYLSDSGRFVYTLQQDRTPGVEPVEDFLFNRQRGHCEYFAAAMVVLLRAVDVPARLVNGYKVTEFNPLGGYHVVRQADAHSWAEAYIDPIGWRTYDPSVMRDVATPRPVFVRRWWRNVYDTLETLWVEHVLQYDTDKQSVVYQFLASIPDRFHRVLVRALLLVGGDKLELSPAQVGRRLKALGRPLMWVGIVVVSLALLVLGGHLIRGALHRRDRRSGPAAAAAEFYRQMEVLLARRGYERAPATTPLEFQAILHKSGWPAMRPVEELTQIVMAVCYGGRPLGEERTQRIREALGELRGVRSGGRRDQPSSRA